MPRVTVVTPTWKRHELLLGRCFGSVQAQTFRDREHVIVSDGPDPALREIFEVGGSPVWGPFRFLELPEHRGELGVSARNWGLDHSESELVAFLDDDNAYRPRHLEVLVAALDADPKAGFAYGMMFYPQTGLVLGSHPPTMNHIDGSMFVARRSLFELARWEWTGAYAIDWHLIAKWVDNGVRSAFVNEITLDYYWRGSE